MTNRTSRGVAGLVIGAAMCLCPAAHAQDDGDGPDIRNHEPFNLMVVNHTRRSVALVNSVIGYVMDDNFLPFSHYGIEGTPFDAINVWRQIWVSVPDTRKIYRFAADIFYPPPLYGEVQTGPIDQIRGMEYVPDNYTVYVCHSGTSFSAPGDRILMFDVTGQPVGSFAATNPMDIMWSPDRGELLVSNATNNAIERFSLDGQYLGRLVDSDGISGIDRPMQMGVNHHTGEAIVCGASPPAGIYYYDFDGDQLAFYPQAGQPMGIMELASEIYHGLLLFSSDLGLFSFWTDTDQLFPIRTGESWGFANKVQFFCWADYDRSDFVDTDDFTAFVIDFEQGIPQADIDGSGFVDIDDYIYFIQRFIEGC